MSNTRIFITSDLHFGHNKEFLYGPRGFSSIEEHDEAVIQNWNSVVTENDIVYILGDVMMGPNRKECVEKVNRLNGTIYIVCGNHDSEQKILDYTKCNNIQFTYDHNNNLIPTYSTMIRKGKRAFYLSHQPLIITGNIFHQDYLSRSISLHGHTHSKDRFEYFEYGCYNVALDAHNNTPVLLDDIATEIVDEFTKRKNNA